LRLPMTNGAEQLRLEVHPGAVPAGRYRPWAFAEREVRPRHRHEIDPGRGHHAVAEHGPAVPLDEEEAAVAPVALELGEGHAAEARATEQLHGRLAQSR